MADTVPTTRTSASRGRRVGFGVIAGVAWFSIVTEVVLLIVVGGPLWALLTCVAFFSIVSNVLVALAATAIAARPDGAFARGKAPTAVAVYVTIVCTIWLALLRGTYSVNGLALVADTLMHVVLPPAYVIAWAVLLPKGGLCFRDAAVWLILPLCYAGVMFIRGAVDGWYPYPFINAAAIGYPRAVLVTAVFTFLFWIVGVGYVGLDRLMGRRSQLAYSRAS